MTTMTMETIESTRRLEELVDRLLATLLGGAPEPAPGLVRTVHNARRLRQSGDLDGALEALNGADVARASDSELRWLYCEWLDIARRRFPGEAALLYGPATARAAVLTPGGGDGTLAVAAVLGLRWPVGKLVSRRCLRGLRPLAKGVA